MKKPKIKKPKLPKKLPDVSKAVPKQLKRGKSVEERMSDAIQNVPRITNETVGEHREEVLSSARKFIYPLQHSKHHIVRISIGIFVAVVVLFFALTGLELYKFQNTGGFMYDVTKVVPFPVAKVGGSWVSYESYLFELRRNMHYYETQQQANFDSKDGQEQLKRLKRQAMDQVVMDAYVKQLAAKNGVSVSNRDVDNQVALVRQQNRLGSNETVFKEVLNEFWGWSVADFKRELKQQMLQQAVVGKLDTQANTKAEAALAQLKGGADFAAVAKSMSEDPATKDNGGQYPVAITPNYRELPPAVTAEIGKLKPGQTSGIIDTGYTLEIVKVLDSSPGSIHAAHIQVNLEPITTYTGPLQKKDPPKEFIKF
jgi:parvulin-like peptidyl-prolyl isomerase